MVPPHAVGASWRAVGVLLVAGFMSAAIGVRHVREAVEAWRSLCRGVLAAVILAGYALLFPGAEFDMYALLVAYALVVGFVAVLVSIAVRFREHHADAVAGGLVIVVVAAAVGILGATPGRQLRLWTVQDRYEAAIAAGRVGDEAGTSDGGLKAWVWVDGHESAVAGVVFDPADNLDEMARASDLTIGNVGHLANCSRLQKTWFWCDFVFDPFESSPPAGGAA